MTKSGAWTALSGEISGLVLEAVPASLTRCPSFSWIFLTRKSDSTIWDETEMEHCVIHTLGPLFQQVDALMINLELHPPELDLELHPLGTHQAGCMHSIFIINSQHDIILPSITTPHDRSSCYAARLEGMLHKTTAQQLLMFGTVLVMFNCLF
jgi:hypothetical protein